MIFANLEKLPPDPILGVTAAFRADPVAGQDRPGRRRLPRRCWQHAGARRGPRCRARAARRAGHEDLRRADGQCRSSTSASSKWRLGPLAAGLKERTATIQTVGGLRGAARRRGTHPRVVAGRDRPRQRPDMGQPRAAARQLGSRAGALPVLRRRRVAASPSSACSSSFGRLPSGSIVLLHACCHNPTGADLDAGQWSRARRGHREPRAGAVRGSRLPGVRRRSRDRRAGLRLAREPRSAVAARAFLLEEFRSLPRAHRGTRRHCRERGRGRRDRDAPGAHREAHVLDAAGPRRGHRGAPAWRSGAARGVGVGARSDGVPA